MDLTLSLDQIFPTRIQQDQAARFAATYGPNYRSFYFSTRGFSTPTSFGEFLKKQFAEHPYICEDIDDHVAMLEQDKTKTKKIVHNGVEGHYNFRWWHPGKVWCIHIKKQPLTLRENHCRQGTHSCFINAIDAEELCPQIITIPETWDK
jgi:hypothetical protein